MSLAIEIDFRYPAGDLRRRVSHLSKFVQLFMCAKNVCSVQLMSISLCCGEISV
jgi:hypothetical protein